MPEQESTHPNTSTNTNPQLKLVDVELTNQNVALNVIIGFITLGQQRGVYSIQESAKIWECIKMFQPQQSNAAAAVEESVEEAVNMDITD
jgi:hypothetical protein